MPRVVFEPEIPVYEQSVEGIIYKLAVALY
jgi:hypothetical protein